MSLYNSKLKKRIVSILAILCVALMITFWTGKSPEVLNAEQEKLVEPVAQAATENLAWNCRIINGNGQAVELRDLYNKKPVCLLFWMPWSRDSLQQLETLASLYDAYGKDVYIAAVSFDRNWNEVFDAVRGKNYPFPIYLAPITIADDYRVYHVPVVFWIEKGGQIMSRDENILEKKEMMYKFERLLQSR